MAVSSTDPCHLLELPQELRKILLHYIIHNDLASRTALVHVFRASNLLKSWVPLLIENQIPLMSPIGFGDELQKKLPLKLHSEFMTLSSALSQGYFTLFKWFVTLPRYRSLMTQLRYWVGMRQVPADCTAVHRRASEAGLIPLTDVLEEPSDHEEELFDPLAEPDVMDVDAKPNEIIEIPDDDVVELPWVAVDCDKVIRSETMADLVYSGLLRALATVPLTGPKLSVEEQMELQDFARSKYKEAMHPVHAKYLAAKSIDLPQPLPRAVYLPLDTKEKLEEFQTKFPDYKESNRIVELFESTPQIKYGCVNTFCSSAMHHLDGMYPPMSSMVWRTHDFVYNDLIQSAWSLLMDQDGLFLRDVISSESNAEKDAFRYDNLIDLFAALGNLHLANRLKSRMIPAWEKTFLNFDNPEFAKPELSFSHLRKDGELPTLESVVFRVELPAMTEYYGSHTFSDSTVYKSQPFNSFEEEAEYRKTLRHSMMMQHWRNLNTAMFMYSFKFTEAAPSEDCHFSSAFHPLVKSLVRNQQFDMLLWISRHFKFWTSPKLLTNMMEPNTYMIKHLTSIMHQLLRGVIWAPMNPRWLGWIETMIFNPLRDDFILMADYTTRVHYKFTTQFSDCLSKWMFIWSNPLRIWLALIMTHRCWSEFPVSYENYNAILFEDRIANMMYGEMQVRVPPVIIQHTIPWKLEAPEKNHYAEIQWLWTMTENLRLDHVKVTTTFPGGTLKLGFQHNGTPVAEEVDLFDPVTHLTPRTRLYWVLVAMNHDFHHTLLEKVNFLPLTEWAKNHFGWKSQLRPIDFTAQLKPYLSDWKASLVEDDDGSFSNAIKHDSYKRIFRELAKLVFHVTTFMKQKRPWPIAFKEKEGTLLLREIFDALLPLPMQEVFKPFMDIVSGLGSHLKKRYPRSNFQTRLGVTGPYDEEGPAFFDFGLVSPTTHHSKWQITIPSDYFKGENYFSSSDSVLFAQKCFKFYARFWEYLTLSLLSNWNSWMSLYSSLLVTPGATQRLILPANNDITSLVAESPCNQTNLLAFSTTALLSALSLIQTIPNNQVFAFAEHDSKRYFQIVELWCKGYPEHVLVAMKQLARVIHLRYLPVLDGSRNFERSLVDWSNIAQVGSLSLLDLLVLMNNISLLTWFHNTFYYAPLRLDDQNQVIWQDETREEIYFEDARTALFTQLDSKGRYSTLLHLACAKRAFDSYRWLRDNYHLPLDKRHMISRIKQYINENPMEQNESALGFGWLHSQKGRLKFNNAIQLRYGPQALVALSYEQKAAKVKIGAKRKRRSRKEVHEDVSEEEEERPIKKPKLSKQGMLSALKKSDDEDLSQEENFELEVASIQEDDWGSDVDDEMDIDVQPPPYTGGKRPRGPPSHFSSDEEDSLNW